MFGQNYYSPYQRQQYYGPLSALGDILGAYMTKKNMEGAMDYAANMGNQIDTATQPKAEQILPAPEQDASQIAAQSFIPHKDDFVNDISKINPAASSGLLAAAKQYAALNPNKNQLTVTAAAPISNSTQGVEPAQQISDSAMAPQAPALDTNALLQQQSDDSQQTQSNSMLQAAQNYADIDPSSPQNQQKKYDAFAAAKAANPEWYVGDTYVGTDAAAKAKAQAELPQLQALQQQAKENSQYGFSNPMQKEYGFQDDKPIQEPSYLEYTQQVKQLKPKAMKELISKYGIDAAKSVEGMIDSAIADKTSAYAEKKDVQNQQALAPYLLRDLSTPQAKQQALWALTQYNNMAKSMGKPGLDMTNMAQIIAANDVAISAKDVGGSIQYFATPKNGGSFADGTYVKPVFATAKTITPDTAASLNEKRFEWTTPSANNTQDNRTRIQTTSMNNDTTLKAASMRASSSGRSGAQQLTAAKGIIAAHQSWVSAHKQAIAMGDAEEADDPNYNNYQRAQQIMAQAAGIGGSQQNNDNPHSDTTGNSVADWINEAYNRGYTKDQIKASLQQKGYGDSYDSYLWD
jgi:hypothetical protein